MKLKSVTSLGAIALVFAVGSAYLVFGVLRYNPLTDYTTLRMELTNSGGLGPKSPVLLTGIEVGRVTDVRAIPSGVEVEMRIDDAYAVPADSAVRIESLSSLGEPYVLFQPRSDTATYLQTGQTIDTSDIVMPVSIPEVASRAVDLINQLDPRVISALVGTASTALAGTQAQIPRLEHATKMLAATILSTSPSVRQLLIDLQVMLGDSTWVEPSLAGAGLEFADFGTRADTAIETLAKVVEKGNPPADYNTGDGIVPFLHNLTRLMHTVGPGFSELAPVIQPLVATVTSSIGQLDISALVSQALASVGDDGAVRLRINVK